MNEIAAGGLLEAWEQGQTQHPLHRALTLLCVGEAGESVDALAALPIGERDRRLLALRCRLFGSRFEAVASCPECQETLDLTFTADQLSSPPPTCAAEMCLGDRMIPIRPPNTLDLLEAAIEPPARRAQVLLERCTGPDLSPQEGAAAEQLMAELDPMAQIEMQLTCPSCGHAWAESFDIASYFWTEVGDGALRLLREIHVLANAYGWSEAQILSVPPRRRRVYLDMVTGT